MHRRFGTSTIGRLFGLVTLLTGAAVHAETITVCWDGSGDYVTIQEGIDAAVDGDEVVVCDGTYTGEGNRDLDFGGKAITVRSASGDPATCIIDCEGNGRGFLFHTGETAASILEGLTITRGSADYRGGAIACEANSNPTIINCVFRENFVYAENAYNGGGGGVHCDESSPTILACAFLNNESFGSAHAVGAGGGAISCGYGSAPLIEDCTFAGNLAWDDERSGYIPAGGAIYCGLGGNDPSIVNCTFTNNTADFGGAIFTYSNTLIRDCTISQNTARYGGGVLSFALGVSIVRCVISRNAATESGSEYGGGGVAAKHCTLSNCTILGNNSADLGAGIFCTGDLSVSDCLIAENDAASFGGGVYCENAARIVRCVIAGNTAQSGGGVYFRFGLDAVSMTNCVVACNSASGVSGHDSAGGAGIACTWLSSPLIANCVFAANASAESGGALRCYLASNPIIVSSTFVGNAAPEYGGAIYAYSGCELNVANSVLWGDAAPFGPEIALGGSSSPSVLTLAFSDAQGGAGAAYVGGESELIWGDGNIDADPLFFDPDGPDDDPDTWQDNDYRLSAGSPCIDAADNTAVPADTLDQDEDGDIDEPIPFDLAGQPRFVDDPHTADTGLGHPDFPELPIVDMGAYEFQACDGDLDGDGDTDQSDLGILLADWGCPGPGCPGDLDGDGDTDQADLGILLADWGCGR